MSTQRLPTPSELSEAVRNRLHDAGESVREWSGEVKTDPTRFWQTPLVRIAFWLILGVAAYFSIRWALINMAPSQAGRNFEEATSTATIFVACTNTSCRASYSAQAPLQFKDWPMMCAKCAQKTAYRAKNCPRCHEFYATVPGQPDECPACAARKAASRPSRKPAPRSGDPDDAEDGW